MKRKHTPKPWVIIPNDNGQVAISSDRGAIAYLTWGKDYKFNPEQQANAHLIISAPELLEACKYAEFVVRHIDGEAKRLLQNKMKEHLDIKFIKKAIAKAEGR